VKTRLAELLSRLERLTPMPEDALLTENMLKEYDEVVTELEQFHDPRCLRPLIESFGYGQGFGIYWRTLHLIEKYDSQLVTKALTAALEHPNPGVRMWAVNILRRYRYEGAVASLAALLQDEAELVRAATVSALDAIVGEDIHPMLEQMQNDPSMEVRASVRLVLQRDQS
jgi:hypothetical protein